MSNAILLNLRDFPQLTRRAGCERIKPSRSCTWLAGRAADEMGRENLKITRDAWIAIANDGESSD
jgi:hypothetical protein